MWIYQGTEFTEDQVGEYIGFVYIITNIKTHRKYIGKKLFTKSKIKQINGKKKKTRVESEWKSYFGSNTELQEEVKINGENSYKKEILHLCKTLSELSYKETYEIFTQEALLKENYYNSWVSVRINKKNLKNIRKD